jgi:hypothetical protein
LRRWMKKSIISYRCIDTLYDTSNSLTTPHSVK